MRIKPIEVIFRAPNRVLLILLVLSLALVGCDHHDHGDHTHGDGQQDHGDHAHGDSERPTHVITVFGEHTEIFVEFPALVAGLESKFAAHFTTLDGYQPVRNGTLSLVLTSQESPGENWAAGAPARPGIFTPIAIPKYPGKRQLILMLKTEAFSETFNLGEFEVFENIEAARKIEVEVPEGGVSFLKEQQWMVDFDMAKAVTRSMRPSVIVNANLRPAAGGESRVTTPFDGRISAPKDGVAQVGQRVEAGQILAYILPSLDAGEITQLRAELRKAKVELSRAERDFERVQGLVTSGAIAEKRLQDAQSTRDIAQADVDQAQQRIGQFRNLESRGAAANGRVAIRSPIDGMIAERTVVDGGFVSRSDSLFRIVDRSKLWLEAHVPEADLPRIGQPTGLWFEPGGKLPPVEIDVNTGGELLSFGDVIDPTTRTAPLIFALGENDAQKHLRIGSFVRAHIYSAEPREALSIPASAVLDEKGLDVVFVMKNGESFERRIVRLGMRDRDHVEVLDGLQPGEHVVSEGVYYVKLASMSTGSVGHGHAH
ncbi:efflux RND transporter periplasmic adaptor subunit [Bradymonas sediminis]|uniref:Uncharacterized protein n=1 Tax=Bradymonas sediminis TaxID=1548548 RepID=A0A2Z4FIF3_9DELT|nr:efflux RND transporter periplasmic adaptor subunit [Bradymonas sediminis]AWV88670.1 hypothetical protein DN745_04680 [Bradymonas sediminis]TDP63644.1 RND family efflux transporter MFP subunit [Bradymonas sediminis]